MTPADTAPTRARPGIGAEAVREERRALLAASVQRLGQALASERTLAWGLDPSHGPYLAAADYTGATPPTPERHEFDCLAALSCATALDQRAELGALARRHGCNAAAPVRGSDGEALAMLLVGGGASDRPRALARLEHAAQRLAPALQAAMTASQLLRREADLRRLDRLAALGSLASAIGHEIRNPLVSLKTFLQLLPEHRGDPEFMTRFADLVGEELRRMERLLDQISEYPRGRDGEGPPADAAAALDATRELLNPRASQRGISLEIALGAPLPSLAIDEDRLRQVLLNLALNALDATPDGGRVVLRVGAAGGGVEITVADSGAGIDPALRDRVFEPFFSTRGARRGGIGLAITRRIVEEAGGSIQAGEAVSGGAEFRVRLPSAPPGDT